MDAHFDSGRPEASAQGLEKGSFRQLSSENLKLKETPVHEKFNLMAVKVLDDNNISYHIRSGSLFIQPSEYGDHRRAEFKIKNDHRVKEEIPSHCFLNFKHTENNSSCPTFLESHRLNENIIDNIISPPLPVARLSVSTDEYTGFRIEDTVMHVAMYQTALTSLSKPKQPRFLTTTHVHDCHAIVFWDKKTQTAVMTHFMQEDMCEQSFDFMLSKITPYAPTKDLTAYIVGGIVKRMGNSDNSFFNFIEKYLNEKNITLKQTFLGEKKRPTDLVFDCQKGSFYELKIINKGRYEFGVTDDRKESTYSFKGASGSDRVYYYTSENEDHFIPVTLTVSPS